jgi:hypothetical protein
VKKKSTTDKKKARRPRNGIAKALRTPKYKKQIVTPKTKKLPKHVKKIAELIWEFEI